MDSYDFDMSALAKDFAHSSTVKTPGAPKKNNSYFNKYVKMPKKEGYVTLRFLPPLAGKETPYCACQVHNFGTPEKANNFYCGKTFQDGKWVGECFFCEYYYHLYRLHDKALADGNEDLAAELKAKATFIKPQQKYYYNAIVLDSDPNTEQGPADGPLVYSCGITMHNVILEACLGNAKMKKKSKGNVFHPLTGRNLQVVKKQKPGGQFPDYSGSEWQDPSPLSEDESQILKWLNSLNDVFDLRKVVTTDEMKRRIRIFEGKEQDIRRTFDASFLDDNAEPVKVSAVNIPTSTPLDSMESVDVGEVEDSLVDDAFANEVRAALGQ